MDDIINYGESYVLHNGEGVIWHFFLNENKRVGYTIKEGDDWSPIYILDSQPLKGYSVTMDKSGIIRLLAYTETKYLIYYEFTKDRWSNRTLERIHSRFQDICYYDIQASSSGTHIIYYISHSLSRSAETLVHYHISREKWQGGRLWRFISDQFTRPIDIQSDDNGSLSMIFYQRIKQKYHLYYAYYDVLSLSWADPIFIHSEDDHYDYRFFSDLNHNHLIIWPHKNEEGYGISLLFKQKADKNLPWTKIPIYNSEEIITNPFLLIDENYYCFWEEAHSIRGNFAKDPNEKWSRPKTLVHIPETDEELALHNLLTIKDGVPNTKVFLGLKYSHQNLFGLEEYPVDMGIRPPENESWGTIIEDDSTRSAQNKSLGIMDKEQILDTIRNDNRNIKRKLDNILNEIERIDNTNYYLQEKVELNEKALFNMNAKLKQLDFKLNQIRTKRGRDKSYQPQYSVYQPEYQPTADDNTQKSIDDDSSSIEHKSNDVIAPLPKKRRTIKTRPIYDYRDNIPNGNGSARKHSEKPGGQNDKDISQDTPLIKDDKISIAKRDNTPIDKGQTSPSSKDNTSMKDKGDTQDPMDKHEDPRESSDDTGKSKKSQDSSQNINIKPHNTVDSKDNAAPLENDTGDSIKNFKVNEPENHKDKKEDIEKISLGDTTILINPPNSEDL